MIRKSNRIESFVLFVAFCSKKSNLTEGNEGNEGFLERFLVLGAGKSVSEFDRMNV